MKDLIRKRLREEISATEAYDTKGTIDTIIDGKRNVGWLGLTKDYELRYIKDSGLSVIKVVKNPGSYIIFDSSSPGAMENARELLQISNKYGGYLAFNATKEDAYRIGQILGYKEEDIQNYIKGNKDLKK